MESHFASPVRSSPERLRSEIEFAAENPIVNGVLELSGGLLAVLNEHRQILALNAAFLRALGIRDPVAVLGTRPGEAIGCVHAEDSEGGCGTGRFCASCGAAIAIVNALATRRPEERKCALSVEHGGRRSELCFRVRATRIDFDDHPLVLVLLTDITAVEKWAELERVFLHDISNLVTGLAGAADLLPQAVEGPAARPAGVVRQLVDRLAREISMQKVLLRDDVFLYEPALARVTAAEVLREVQGVFVNHPASRGKSLELARPVPPRSLTTDPLVVTRIVTNMLLNAFEATEPGGSVRLWVEEAPGSLLFCVWNASPIPQILAPRLFQRYFSTKDGDGRGIGTYAMRLFGEQILGGSVDFESSAARGTTFRLRIPAGAATPSG